MQNHVEFFLPTSSELARLRQSRYGVDKQITCSTASGNVCYTKVTETTRHWEHMLSFCQYFTLLQSTTVCLWSRLRATVVSMHSCTWTSQLFRILLVIYVTYNFVCVYFELRGVLLSTFYSFPLQWSCSTPTSTTLTGSTALRSCLSCQVLFMFVCR